MKKSMRLKSKNMRMKHVVITMLVVALMLSQSILVSYAVDEKDSLTPPVDETRVFPDKETPTSSPPTGGTMTPSIGGWAMTPSNGEVADSTGSWALCNLILCVLGGMLAIIIVIYSLKRRKREQDEVRAACESASEEDKVVRFCLDYKQKRRRPVWWAVAMGMVFVSAILFSHTQDMSLPMTLVNAWTVIHAFILVVEIAAIVIARKRVHEVMKFKTIGGSKTVSQH